MRLVGCQIDPHSASPSTSSGSTPLPRSTGERKGATSQRLAPFLSLRRGERWPNGPEWGRRLHRPKPPKVGITKRARKLRQGGNEAEALLWLELKKRSLGGYRFTRQLPIGRFFADFACREKWLVVEIDGSQHADNPRDRVRDEFMRAQGYSVLRFWNTDVLKHRRSVCETILAALDGRLTGDVAASDLRYVYSPPASRSSRQLIGIHP